MGAGRPATASPPSLLGATERPRRSPGSHRHRPPGGAELSGERMTVAYENQDQEDEHSCFSDTTHVDIIGNRRGHPERVPGPFGRIDGPGLDDLVSAVDRALDTQDEGHALPGDDRRDRRHPRAVRPGDPGDDRPGPPRRLLQAFSARADAGDTLGRDGIRAGAPDPWTRCLRCTPSPRSSRRSGDLGTLARAACPRSRRRRRPRSSPGGDDDRLRRDREAFARRPQPQGRAPRRRSSSATHFFNRNWITAPASTTGIDGLGPLVQRHLVLALPLKDGRGRPGAGDQPCALLRAPGVPGTERDGGPLDDPSYGGQLQSRLDRACRPRAEARGRLDEEVRASLRRRRGVLAAPPTYSFEDLAFGPLAAGRADVAAGRAGHASGLGLLELGARASTCSRRRTRRRRRRRHLGPPQLRLGSRREQRSRSAASAGRRTSRAVRAADRGRVPRRHRHHLARCSRSENCTAPRRPRARRDPRAARPRLERRDAAAGHALRAHAGGARAARPDDPTVLRGKRCSARPAAPAATSPTVETGRVSELPELPGQTIGPYTDLLLHDMGDELADDRARVRADGREWRTPPLWGLGLRRDGERPPAPAARRSRARLRRGDPVARRRGEAAREAFRR